MLPRRIEITQFFYLELQIHLQERKKGKQKYLRNNKKLSNQICTAITCLYFNSYHPKLLVKNNIQNSITLLDIAKPYLSLLDSDTAQYSSPTSTSINLHSNCGQPKPYSSLVHSSTSTVLEFLKLEYEFGSFSLLHIIYPSHTRVYWTRVLLTQYSSPVNLSTMCHTYCTPTYWHQSS